ncbi:MAG: hypothetical protein IK990_20850 [Ruminiclostridium sp.]|nr:hypothetical protein [Ruminiclostridium sp.]
MNNIIKSQMFIMKQQIVSLTAIFIVAVLTIIFGLRLGQDPAKMFSQSGTMALFVILFMPVSVISYCYFERIQVYEIMAGFRPHQIIFGRAITFMPCLLIFLAAAAVTTILSDCGPQVMTRLMLYSILCLRAMFCVVFLSPFLQQGSFFPLFSAMLLMIDETDREALLHSAHSPLSFLFVGQCMMLGDEITSEFVVKVIVSAVVSCAIYYLIGHFTLKKKFDLEPHKLT